MKTAFILLIFTMALTCSCDVKKEKVDHITTKKEEALTAEKILGNPDYQAISYGGYRKNSRDIQPTISEIKKDLKILSAMDIKVLRTYNTKLKHASTLLKAIRELKNENAKFEMYVMLGAWIDCENAWTDHPNHEGESREANKAEIGRAVKLANEYKDIVKIIAVGNEAMVKWAASYFVQPWVVLKWVNHLQELKTSGDLPKDLWVTSSDNFASWGGGDTIYHVEDLSKLVKAVDFVSLHTYPMHDTHYNPIFWGISEKKAGSSKEDLINNSMERAKNYAVSQYENTKAFINTIDKNKPIHIGETGWASSSNGHYGEDGSKATDEYKQALYYNKIRKWSNETGISCFYFEAFDEIWKDAKNPGGSENHFGLFTINGKAKYGIWDLVDKGTFMDLNRENNPITKTYNGKEDQLLKDVLLPPIRRELELTNKE